MTAAPLARLRTLATNAWITAGTVAHHTGDDPVVFCLQISRRLPARWVRPAATALGRLPGDRWPAARATGLHVTGQDDAALAVLRAVSDRARPATRRRCAEVALALGEVELTDELLAGIAPSTAGVAGTRARRHWYLGHVDAAVDTLESAVRAGSARRGTRAQWRRLSAERDLLGSFTPHVEPIPGYRPRANTALHAVTNSLPHTTSGYAQRTHSVLTALRDEGWHVHAVTRPGYPVQVGKLLARATDTVDGIAYHRVLPARLAPTATGRVQQHAEALLRLALEVRPAVLHTTTHYVNALAVHAVAQALGIPWVYEVRGLLADTWAATRAPEARHSQRYTRFQAREAWAVRAAHDTVTLGHHMAERVRAIAGDPALPVRLSPNAVGGALLDAPGTKSAARRRTGLPQDRFLVGTVTSVVDYEGLDHLLHAVALARHEVPTILAVIVGDGTARPALEHLATTLDLHEHVTFRNRVAPTEAVHHHRALDVFTVPRKDLAVTRAVTPLKPVEAMAAATTVLASDLPALRETIRHGVTGVLVPPEDPRALADALIELAADPHLRTRLAAAGRAWALEQRTWTIAAKRTVTRYCELTGTAPITSDTLSTPRSRVHE